MTEKKRLDNYVIERQAAAERIISESMDRKLGNRLPAYSQVNPHRANRTSSEYDIFNW